MLEASIKKRHWGRDRVTARDRKTRAEGPAANRYLKNKGV